MPATLQNAFRYEDADRAIRALSELHNTGNTSDHELALKACEEDRAAFWTSAGYSNQIARIFLDVANRDGLEAALARCARDDSSLYLRHTTYLVGTLIPLNAKANEARNRVWERLGCESDTIRRARAARPAPMFDDTLQAAE